ncbi:hypothetical protein OK016_11200 [Vibrio chagasii]|nr:hypothetical protein [Vibrio chagasii]
MNRSLGISPKNIYQEWRLMRFLDPDVDLVMLVAAGSGKTFAHTWLLRLDNHRTNSSIRSS